MRMRGTFAVIAVLGALTALAAITAGIAAPSKAPLLAQAGAREEVDVELVLAVDISYSMDPEEQKLQREGYMTAITSREFLSAVRNGIHGKVAITYFEWAGANDQGMILPWRIIDGPEAADSVANEIARAPYRRAARTSISGAMLYAKPLFDSSGVRGIRRVIDISGDGPNNNGPLVEPVRDDIVRSGITINGLPIMLNRPNAYAWGDIDSLDSYYEDCVIGGPGAFVVPIKEREKFKEATRTKLVLEIAGRMPAPRLMPAQASGPRPSCMIGERRWQERWGR